MIPIYVETKGYKAALKRGWFRKLPKVEFEKSTHDFAVMLSG
jgi:hypothetical protein